MGIREHKGFLIFFGITSSIFLWRLITMQGLFIGGDSFVQFYPWFKAYAESIKAFEFPFWVRYMQSGFPLMAEGQVGGYYPLNMLFFFTLPFNIAYNYSIIFHFVLGGISIYFLARRLGACQWGGALSALTFCFGSAYAGCFYNIITLRTLSWTPLVFLLFEHYFKERDRRYILLAGIVFGFQLLAGFAQAAIYSGVFYLLYFIYKMRLTEKKDNRRIVDFIIFSATAIVLFLPQLILTSRLAHYSSRSVTGLGFALWGSFNPAGLLGTVFPYWASFTKNDLYISIIGLLFLIASLHILKVDKRIRPIFLILIVSFLLALGRYNPFYLLLLKITKLYIFRNPSKFLFFTAMSASVLIGRGLSAFFNKEIDFRKVLKHYSVLLVSCASLFLISGLILRIFRNQILLVGRWMAENLIYAKPHHRYSLDLYLDKVDSFYLLLLKGSSFANVSNIISWIILLIALIGCWIFIRKRGSLNYGYARAGVIFLIFIDLLAFGNFKGTGFKGNIRPVQELSPDYNRIYHYIKSDNELFRILPYNAISGRLPNWSLPNANIIYAIDSIAGYTPLANGYYQKALDGLEVVDNSLGVLAPADDSLARNLDLIRLLNVKYLISPEKLKHPFLRFILEEDGIILYRLKGYLPRAFVYRSLVSKQKVDRRVGVEIVEYRSGSARFRVDMPYEGFLVFSENRYPGWSVYIDGEKGKIEPFSLIQAVAIKKGRHVVKFVYEPYDR